MTEISGLVWGVSIAFNIILLLTILPLCILMVCCCRRPQKFKKDINTLARNHNFFEESEEDEQEDYVRMPRQRKIKAVRPRATRQIEYLYDDDQQDDQSNSKPMVTKNMMPEE